MPVLATALIVAATLVLALAVPFEQLADFEPRSPLCWCSR